MNWIETAVEDYARCPHGDTCNQGRACREDCWRFENSDGSSADRSGFTAPAPLIDWREHPSRIGDEFPPLNGTSAIIALAIVLLVALLSALWPWGFASGVFP
jgi:hypothetical protein